MVSLAAVEWFLLLGDAAHRGPSGKGFSHNPLCQFCARSGMFSDAEEGRLQALTAEMYIRETESSIIRAFSRSCQWNLKETTWFIDCRKDVD